MNSPATPKRKSPSGTAAGEGRSTRDLLLDATGALMSEGNTTNVSFADISERSGINSALIRYHFGSKQGLLEALIERDAGSSYDGLDRLVSLACSPEEKMRKHIQGIMRLYHRYPYLNRLLIELQSQSESDIARHISERYTRRAVDAQTAIIDEGVKAGVFRKVDPMLFHFSLVGACDSIFHSRSALDHVFGVKEIDETLRERFADQVAEIVLAGLKPTPE
ncbi:TetR family transcriptional regulator [Novosphingobium sp. KCTC 2891]|uniref:TetR family transcriptional regulator n=1 Tax=Novosphingobium sp. KCTC 2891 TaxID=2989730 RepID=UPI0022232988|nr:TetR family transcriptional regulator [Novosphingobium sp. KCTC 2891]MCW1383161.1 TetR family transcriptional regulator [Novosphingobium sp. KCTC 2891]